jgi:cytoskeletal protein RodZ
MALEQIGQKLKAAREGQGLSLAQIYEKTKIPINHLQSIDSGVSDDLPEPVYVAGFIKRYAECVGLNGQSLSDEYRKQSSGNGNGDSNWAAKAVLTAPVAVHAPHHAQRLRVDDRPPSLLKTMVFPFIWIVGLLGLFIVLFQINFNNNASQQDPSLLTLRDSTAKFNQVQPSPTAAAVTQPGQNPPPGVDASQQPNPQDSESQVTLTASQHVWVDIKSVSTGESVFTGFLEAGDRRDFKDPQGLRVHAGNGGSLTVESQGKSQTLGLPGHPTEKVFMAKNPAPDATTALGPDGKPLAAGQVGAGAATAIKPVVKKIIKRTPTADAAATTRRHFRSIDDVPSRSVPGDSVGGRSIDVPSYTGGRIDND